MAVTGSEVVETPPKGLYQVGRIWWMSYNVAGRRFRESTGSDDLAIAAELLRLKRANLCMMESTSQWARHVASGLEIGGWLRALYNSAARRSRDNARDFPLTMDALQAIALRSDGACEVTGVRFQMERWSDGRSNPFAPSLDRKNAGSGYIVPNCRLVCSSVNYAMNRWGEEVIERIALGYLSKIVKFPR